MTEYYVFDVEYRNIINIQWYLDNSCHRIDGLSDSYDLYEYNNFSIAKYKLKEKNLHFKCKADII